MKGQQSQHLNYILGEESILPLCVCVWGVHAQEITQPYNTILTKATFPPISP